METIYEQMWSKRSGELMDELDQSLKPRPQEMLYDVAKELGINASYAVLDAGSGLGIYACGLASRFGCRVTGLELAQNNLQWARARAEEQKVTQLVGFQHGNVESIPFADATFDLVWRRDMLAHVRDLKRAMSEFTRVLKPGGSVLIHHTFATDHMEPREAARLYSALANVPENMSPAYFEQAIADAGLLIRFREEIGSEWLEYSEEQQGRYSHELLHIARMRRRREQLVAAYGQVNCDVIIAVALWHIYRLIGKLSSRIYTLRKAPFSAKGKP